MDAPILGSACLTGRRCRYDGGCNPCEASPRLTSLINKGKAIAICPECDGGMPTPRDPSEIESGKSAEDVLSGCGRVLTAKGIDVTAHFVSGARHALELAKKHNVRIAILKARSPSCGNREIYDGTFSKVKIQGRGITAELLSQNGLKIFNETEIDSAISFAETADFRR